MRLWPAASATGTPGRLVVTLLAVVVGLGGVTAAHASPSTVQWPSPVTLSEAGKNAMGPQIAASTDGMRLTAVWDLGGRIQVSRSGDGGATWTTPLDLSAAGSSASGPQIASSDNGERLVVLWVRPDSDGDLRVEATSSDNGGDTWSAPQALSQAGQDADEPSVVSSADGSRVTAVWSRWDFLNERILRVQASSSSNGGADWSAAQNLIEAEQDPDSPGTAAPQVAASDDGRALTVAWYVYTVLDSRIEVAHSADGGVVWTPAETISSTRPSGLDPQVAVAADGSRRTVVWYGFENSVNGVQASTSTDAGDNWTPPKTVSEGQRRSGEPQLAASTDGTQMTVVWQHTDGADIRVRAARSSDSGGDWSTPLFLSEPGAFASVPQIAGSADGSRLIAVWTRREDNINRVQASSSADGGATWSVPQTISTAGQDARDPQVVIASAGTAPIALFTARDGADLRAQVSTGSLSTLPSPPRGVSVTPGNGLVEVSWSPPADDGNSPVTGYTATATPGGQSCETTASGCTITGLANGTSYTVLVTATNAVGASPPSDPSDAFTPAGPEPTPGPSTPPAPAPPETSPSPPGAQPPDRTAARTQVLARATSKRSKLKVRVLPDLGARVQWKFVVLKKSSGKWRAVKPKRKGKFYRTRGAKHVRVVNLPRGKYKARSIAARGYGRDTSKVIRIRR